MTTTRARHRSRTREPFVWSRRWEGAGRVSAFAAVSGRWLPEFDAQPDGPYGSGNVGLSVGDDPDEVHRRRAALAGWAGARRLVMAHQVHGVEVARVGHDSEDVPTADALVTTEPGLLLGVAVADCVPVMLVDPGAGVAGVAHAGRAGMAAGVVPALLDAMAELGSTAAHAVVGPSICARCYEVPAQLRDEVAALAPLTASVSRTGTASLDVAAGVLAQLHPRVADVELVPGCTAEEPELFSHRASGGAAGRFAGYVALLDPPGIGPDPSAG